MGDLLAAYAREIVEPLLEGTMPGMPLALARLGSGSDVLGYDDVVSQDHDWGLRMTVLVPERDVERVEALLEERLPDEFRGLPTRFATTWDPHAHQRAEVASVAGFTRSRTGLDVTRPLDTLDWLSLTGQSALELTAGPVWRDDTGELAAARVRLRAYPDDVRRFAIASGWQAIAQELPFVARAAERGDDVGSRAIAARLVTAAMRIGFLLESRWAPYSKWVGTAFAQLPRAGRLAAPLSATVTAASGSEREAALVDALDDLAEWQGEAGLPTLTPATEPFFDRGSRGVRALAAVVRASIADPEIRALPLIGTPEQWSGSVDVLMRPELRRAVAATLLAPA